MFWQISVLFFVTTLIWSDLTFIRTKDLNPFTNLFSSKIHHTKQPNMSKCILKSTHTLPLAPLAHSPLPTKYTVSRVNKNFTTIYKRCIKHYLSAIYLCQDNTIGENMGVKNEYGTYFASTSMDPFSVKNNTGTHTIFTKNGYPIPILKEK